MRPARRRRSVSSLQKLERPAADLVAHSQVAQKRAPARISDRRSSEASRALRETSCTGKCSPMRSRTGLSTRRDRHSGRIVQRAQRLPAVLRLRSGATLMRSITIASGASARPRIALEHELERARHRETERRTGRRPPPSDGCGCAGGRAVAVIGQFTRITLSTRSG